MTKIFISYRRSDDPYAARSINDELRNQFGKDKVYFDLDSMKPGLDWRVQIDQMVSECDVMLVVIGDRWVQMNESGHSRLENEDDLVLLEVSSALNRDIPVIPVLVGNARIPAKESLPEKIQSLVYRQAVEVRATENFSAQLNRLLRSIEAVAPEPELPQSESLESETPGREVRESEFAAALLWKWLIPAILFITIVVSVYWDKFPLQSPEESGSTLNDCQPNLTLSQPEIVERLVNINGVVLPSSGCPEIDDIQWKWGDGTVTNSWFPASHQYTESGEYEISITAIDTEQNSNTQSVSITIIESELTGTKEIIPLHYEISSRFIFSKWIHGKFLIGLKSPNELLLLDEQGKPITNALQVAGEPISVAGNADSIFVGQRFPGVIEQFDKNLISMRQFKIPDAEAPNQVWSGSPSTEPKSIAAGKDSVWVNTEGNGIPIIYHLNLKSGEWSVPDFDGLGHDNDGWRLSYAWETFFAVTSNTTPSSIYKLTEAGVIEFGGHDNESVSCTPAIWEGTVGDITAISCDEELVELRAENDPKIIKSWGKIPPFYVDGWSHYEITASGNDFVVARTNYSQNPWHPVSTVVEEIHTDGTSYLLFEEEEIELLSVTSSPAVVILGTSDPDGNSQAYRIVK